jgi:uncharacterized protein (DUF362 family)/ferredoxin
MSKQTTLSIVKIESENIQKAVFDALELIGAKSLMNKPNMKILLKPNVLIAKDPSKAATTHPEVVRAVIRWLKQFNPSQIYCGDSSGGLAAGITEKALKVCGIQAVCEEEGAICVPLEKTERKMYQVKNPIVLNEIMSTKLLEEADLIINLPKIKTHGQCVLTCCIKNLFGTILLGNKPSTHAKFPRLTDFNAALCDIYSVSNPQLTIIDGYLAMEGNGPSGGDPVKMDLIMAGYDPIALDTTVCKIIGINPEKVLYLKHGEDRGLGSMDLTNVEFKGKRPEEVFRKFKMPKSIGFSIWLPRRIADYASKTVFRSTIHFDDKKCKVCGTCWKNCPVNAITPPKEMKQGNVPTWDSKKCITCYCCAELCPYEAVEFKVNIVKNVVKSWFFILGLLGIAAIVIILMILL